jgi:hypothetical protein
MLFLCQEDMDKAFVVEWGDLYKVMCSILDLVTEKEFDIAYQRMKTTYANNNWVLKYVE